MTGATDVHDRHDAVREAAITGVRSAARGVLDVRRMHHLPGAITRRPTLHPAHAQDA